MILVLSKESLYCESWWLRALGNIYSVVVSLTCTNNHGWAVVSLSPPARNNFVRFLQNFILTCGICGLVIVPGAPSYCKFDRIIFITLVV